MQFISQQIANAMIGQRGFEGPYVYQGEEYTNFNTQYGSQGYITEYSNQDFCHSFVILPGFSLSSTSVQGTVYFLILIYLFLGIALVADIFMEAIETITSKMTVVTIPTAEGPIAIEKPVWNPTIANLTLMALGSSAPEIILSIAEVAKDIGATPGELGPMTIVGSASFNLMVISAVSIYSVTEVKKIFDLNVFFITAISSTWAYIWFFLVLAVISPDTVEMWEAWLTLGFMGILLVFAYGADRCTNRQVDSAKQKEDTKKSHMKQTLRMQAKKYGTKAIIECAFSPSERSGRAVIPDSVVESVRDSFKALLDVETFENVSIEQLIECLNPENPVERIAYRK